MKKDTETKCIHCGILRSDSFGSPAWGCHKKGGGINGHHVFRPTPPETSSWEEGFDKLDWRIWNTKTSTYILIPENNRKHYKDFIRSVASSEYKRGVDSQKEIVICAAVRATDGKIVRGHRHNDAMRTLQGMPAYKDERPHGDDQGFVTSLNRYVTRKEGCEIQIAAGIESFDTKKPYCGEELYSEDLY